MNKHYLEENIPEKRPVLIHYQKGETKSTFAYTHMHKYIEMIYCKNGNFNIILDGKKHTFSKGDFVVINSMETHAIYSVEDCGGDYICMRVLPEALYFPNDINYDFKYIMPFILSSSQRKRVFKAEEIKNSLIPQMMENVLKEESEKKFGYELAMKSQAQRIILWVTRNCNISEQSTTMEVIEKIRNLLIYIEENYAENITAYDGAQLCRMSYSYFSRTFKKLMKRSFSEYLNYIRVLKAEAMLAATDKTVTEIAMECGFSTPSYFIKNFKKIKGITPKQSMAKISRGR